ncbi:MAG: M48 family metalloprotease, partial [Deltaproteobacteria bacterium]|nr:M48 family metalloprotease [Deltaproteobacteria bacterium]
GPQPFPYHFSIIRSPYLNAFAVPGGYIYLNTGTINTLNNEGQMAAILAHEVAHVTSRHFSRRSDAASSINLLTLAGMIAGIALASSGGGGQNTAALGQALILGSTGATIQTMLANSRADETEADTKGRAYMIKAGYHPRDMYGAFKIMNDQSYQLSRNIPDYLSTHPGLSARLASTFADQADAPKPGPDPTFQDIKDRTMAMTGNASRARTMFRQRLAENPNDASAFNGLGLLAIREVSYPQAEKLLTKAAELKPGEARFLTDLGDLALKMRKPEEAIKRYEQARKAGADNLLATLGLARAYELTGRLKEASSLYDKALFQAGEDYPPALEMAGRFFGQNGQQAKGHFALSTYYVLTGRFTDALFHCGAAQKAPNGMTYKARCDQRGRDLEEVMEALGQKAPEEKKKTKATSRRRRPGGS